MNETEIPRRPEALEAILTETERLGFTMTSDVRTGFLLRTLARSSKHSRRDRTWS